MKLKFISDVQSLDTSQQNWDSIAGESPFFSYAWMMNWFRILGRDFKLALLIAEDEQGKWIGIAPWCIDETGPFSRKLRFLGSGTACSDYVDLICDPKDQRWFSEVAVDWLVENIGNRETLGRLDAIELEGISPDSQGTQYVCDLFDAHGLKSHTVELEGGWVVDLPSKWEELNSRFSKSMRRKTRKAVQRLGGPSTEVISTDDGPLDELWPFFTGLHQQRRRKLGQEGCFADPEFEEFLKSATRDLIKQTKAELVVIKSEDRPLASMLLLNNDETVFMYQSGCDTSRMKLEPGYQITYCAIERSIRKGFKHFDFLRGDEPYKARWNTRRKPIHRTRLIPGNPVAKLKHGLWLTGHSIKNYIRPVTP